jgi:hypothetical protein
VLLKQKVKKSRLKQKEMRRGDIKNANNKIKSEHKKRNDIIKNLNAPFGLVGFFFHPKL